LLFITLSATNSASKSYTTAENLSELFKIRGLIRSCGWALPGGLHVAVTALLLFRTRTVASQVLRRSRDSSTKRGICPGGGGLINIRSLKV